MGQVLLHHGLMLAVDPQAKGMHVLTGFATCGYDSVVSLVD